jgi:hypothetical protein
MAELDGLDREHGLGTMPRYAGTAQSPRGRVPSPVLPFFITVLVLIGALGFAPGESMGQIRQLVGLRGERPDVVPLVDDGGSFEFSETQVGGTEPVGYNPCGVIEVAVNPSGAPDDYDRLVDTAIAHTSAATGLRFKRVGLTDDRDFSRRGVGLGGSPPVLVAWATPEEVPALAGEVAGIGGSAAIHLGTGRMRYATGMVVLDRDVFASFTAMDASSAQAIVDHEFGHLVGLAHVDDPDELMYHDNLGQTTYGPGDREGLARLGRIDC